MSRPRLLFESQDGVYHVLNRGNYRSHVFQSDRTKAAFLHCLGEACVRTGWQVHAWCLMSNHFHLALTTPLANLADGMRWFQGTFASRFNRLRRERGHLFQGRYKSLVVDPAGGLGPLCHYIHLNPVRARLCPVQDLAGHRWTSLGWLFQPRLRPTWYQPAAALAHAGDLADNPTGWRQYLGYLSWLAEDEPARKAQQFEAMSRGWIIGTREFATAILQERKEQTRRVPEQAEELSAAREALWTETLALLLGRLGHSPAELKTAGKSVEWKLAAAAGMKAHTTVTNRWLAETLRMGHPSEVSRKVTAWTRQPDPALLRIMATTPNPKA